MVYVCYLEVISVESEFDIYENIMKSAIGYLKVFIQ